MKITEQSRIAAFFKKAKKGDVVATIGGRPYEFQEEGSNCWHYYESVPRKRTVSDAVLLFRDNHSVGIKYNTGARVHCLRFKIYDIDYIITGEDKPEPTPKANLYAQYQSAVTHANVLRGIVLSKKVEYENANKELELANKQAEKVREQLVTKIHSFIRTPVTTSTELIEKTIMLMNDDAAVGAILSGE